MTNLAFFVLLCDSGPFFLSFVAFVDFIAWTNFVALIRIRINCLPVLGLLVDTIIPTLLQNLVTRNPLVVRRRDFVGWFISDVFSYGAFGFLPFCLFVIATFFATFSTWLLCIIRFLL